MRVKRTILVLCCISALLLFSAQPAQAYVHMVTQGETLAQIALRVYGNPKLETVLVGANSLDAKGGQRHRSRDATRDSRAWSLSRRIGRGVAGARPAILGQRQARRDTREGEPGRVVGAAAPMARRSRFPAVLSYISGEGDTMSLLSQRYLGDVNLGWALDAYNGRKGTDKLKPGDVVLVPLPDLQLTQAGKDEARRTGQTGEGLGVSHDAQKRAETELPSLLSEVRGGRYVDVIARGNRLMGSGELTRAQLATVHRALLEAYVALDAAGAAKGACDAFRANADPKSDRSAEALRCASHVAEDSRTACGLH